MSQVEPQTEPAEAPDEAPDAVPPESLEPVTEDDEAAEAEEVEGQEGELGDERQRQAEGLSQKQLEAAFGKLERETERHAKRVQEIMGDDAAMLAACPLCDPLIPGFVMPTPNTPERFPAVRQFMGDAQPAEYRADPNTRQCQTCGGEGVVETGSKVEGQVTLVCTDCGGRGWQGSRAPVATSGPMAPALVAAGNGEAQPTPQGPEPPEAAKLRAMGYTLIQPVGT